MQKGRPVKQYMVEYRIGKDWIIGFEKLINDKYNQWWEYVEIRSLKVNEYKIIFRKIGGEKWDTNLKNISFHFGRAIESVSKLNKIIVDILLFIGYIIGNTKGEYDEG